MIKFNYPRLEDVLIVSTHQRSILGALKLSLKGIAASAYAYGYDEKDGEPIKGGIHVQKKLREEAIIILKEMGITVENENQEPLA